MCIPLKSPHHRSCLEAIACFPGISVDSVWTSRLYTSDFLRFLGLKTLYCDVLQKNIIPLPFTISHLFFLFPPSFSYGLYCLISLYFCVMHINFVFSLLQVSFRLFNFPVATTTLRTYVSFWDKLTYITFSVLYLSS